MPPNPVTVTWCSECGARVVLSHDPVPFWVKRAMERIKEVHGPLMRASTCMGVALAILREEAAKDGVEIYA